MFRIAKLLFIKMIIIGVVIVPFKALSGDLITLNLQSNDIECMSCALNIKGKLSKIAGVRRVEVSASSRKIHVEYDSSIIAESRIIQIIKHTGYKAEKVN